MCWVQNPNFSLKFLNLRNFFFTKNLVNSKESILISHSPSVYSFFIVWSNTKVTKKLNRSYGNLSHPHKRAKNKKLAEVTVVYITLYHVVAMPKVIPWVFTLFLRISDRLNFYVNVSPKIKQVVKVNRVRTPQSRINVALVLVAAIRTSSDSMIIIGVKMRNMMQKHSSSRLTKNTWHDTLTSMSSLFVQLIVD